MEGMSHLDLMRRKSTGHALVLAAQGRRYPTNSLKLVNLVIHGNMKVVLNSLLSEVQWYGMVTFSFGEGRLLVHI